MVGSKPRAFIGSSVEGRHIAFAVQQNLMHDVEATVWDQGAFELSTTSIEALERAVQNSDFGIFVFSPDDEVRMRGQASPSIRDNVLFEAGLFIGSLGRERVFFLVPQHVDMHIPSDLLGVTPARYETGRSDNNMQAATGPACSQMRVQIQSLPRLRADSSPAAPEPATSKRAWYEQLFEDKDFAEAKKTLESELLSLEEDEARWHKAWIGYCDLKLDEKAGLQALESLSMSNQEDIAMQEAVATMLRFGRFPEKALALIKLLPEAVQENPRIKVLTSVCIESSGDVEKARTMLSEEDTEREPLLAIRLSEMLEKADRGAEALDIIQKCHRSNPNHEKLLFHFALLAQRKAEHVVALFLLDRLTIDFPKNPDYWGYLGNTCLDLDLLDLALRCYRKAESLYEDGGAGDWIQANIGNLLSHVELPSEAIPYFQRVLKKDPETEYSLARLAEALKAKAEKTGEYDKKREEGRQALRNWYSRANPTSFLGAVGTGLLNAA